MSAGTGTTTSPSRAAGRSQVFDEAARLVVEHLRAVVPMGAWAVTRVVDGTQVFLVSTDEAYGYLGVGAEFPRSSSICRTMTIGATPRVAPDAAATPSLAPAVTAARAASVPVGAYVGTPVVRPDGSLFGTVCGFHPDPLRGVPEHLEALLDLVSSLLSAVLEADTAATAAERSLERAAADARTDALTGLQDRRGWERWIAAEADRFRRFGDPASVLMLDLDLLKQVNDTRGHAAGDDYLRAAARVLRDVVPADGVVARLGGDEFAAVVPGAPARVAELVAQLRRRLAEAGVEGSVGVAGHGVLTGFPAACEAADAAMFADKRARRAGRERPRA